MRQFVSMAAITAILSLASTAQAASSTCPRTTSDSPGDMSILPCHLISIKGGETIGFLNLKIDQQDASLTIQGGPKGGQIAIYYYKKCESKNQMPQQSYEVKSISPNRSLWVPIKTNCTFEHVEEIMPGNGNKYGTVAINLLQFPSGTDLEVSR